MKIANTSVAPFLPRGNPNLACMMIGEKSADLVRGERLAPEPAMG